MRVNDMVGNLHKDFTMRKYTGVLVLGFLLAAFQSHAVDICAHRGANRVAPENTVPAFEAAVKAGAGQVELDVDMSKDGVLVLMHDSTVDRTTNGRGKVADLTFSELRSLDAGAKFDSSFAGTKVPTLRDALEAIPPRIYCNVHLKGDERAAVETAKTIRDMGRLDRCFLTMGDTQMALARTARSAVPGIMVCKGWHAARELSPEAYIIAEKPGEGAPDARNRVDFIQFFSWTGVPPADSLKAKVDELHRRGIKVNYCCGNDEKAVRTLVEAGVDYILTDDIPLVKGIIREFGKKKK